MGQAEGFVERDARFSPDGRWIAYVSEESGRPEVSVRSLSGAPKPLNVPPLAARHWGTVYDVSPDGTRVFLPRPDRRPVSREIGVVLNWTDLVR